MDVCPNMSKRMTTGKKCVTAQFRIPCCPWWVCQESWANAVRHGQTLWRAIDGVSCTLLHITIAASMASYRDIKGSAMLGALQQHLFPQTISSLRVLNVHVPSFLSTRIPKITVYWKKLTTFLSTQHPNIVATWFNHRIAGNRISACENCGSPYEQFA